MSLNVFTAAGNVRVKMYDDNAGAPNNLIGESGSIAVSGTGIQAFPVSATIPASGIVWACFEADSGALDLKYANNVNQQHFVAHVYGAGPNPFGAQTLGNNAPWTRIGYTGGVPTVRIKIYQDDNGTGGPSTLLGQSAPQLISTTGQQNFSISAVVPASGNIFAGFETNSTALDLYETITFGMYFVTHSFGTGPSPFGTAHESGSSPWMQVTYSSISPVINLNPPSGPINSNTVISGSNFHNNQTLDFSFDGNPITTIPATIKSDNTGAFTNAQITIPVTNVGPHTVIVCDTSGSCGFATFTITGANISNFAAGTQTGNTTKITPEITTDTPLLAKSQSLYFSNKTLIQTITYPQPIPIFTLNSQVPLQTFTDIINNQYTFYENATLTDGFVTYTIKSQLLTFTPLFVFTPVNITPGQQNFSTTNTNSIPIMYSRIDKFPNTNNNSTNLLVSYPSTFNLTCNLAFKFSQTNKTYFNIPHTTLPNGRFQANFTFKNTNSEIITTNCTDINTHASALYLLTQTNFPLQQNVAQFRSGQFGTHGQFGVLDIISLIGILTAMIGLSRVNEAAGIVIAVIMLGILSFFQIVTWQTTVTGIIAVIAMIAIVTTKKLPWSQ